MINKTGLPHVNKNVRQPRFLCPRLTPDDDRKGFFPVSHTFRHRIRRWRRAALVPSGRGVIGHWQFTGASGRDGCFGQSDRKGPRERTLGQKIYPKNDGLRRFIMPPPPPFGAIRRHAYAPVPFTPLLRPLPPPILFIS